ncbi:MAG: hypothetical protein GWP14_05545 [Actinobacteria bacterium]|nr:hypothetical protein [Actinomycetota bacterium]
MENSNTALSYSDPPRVITARIRYRALAAKPVSILLLIGLVTVAVCAYTARGHFRDWSRIRRLKSVGRSAQAVVTNILRCRPGGQRGAAREYIAFEFRPLDPSDAQPVSGQRLHSLFLRQIKLGDKLDVTYDPATPEDFFCPEVDDQSLIGRLSAQIIFLIAVLALLLWACFRYFALLRIVRNSPAQLGTVVEIGPCAQGAFSRLVVVTLQVADRVVILKRVVPARLAQSFSIGDSIWLLVPPGKPHRGIIAAAFI